MNKIRLAAPILLISLPLGCSRRPSEQEARERLVGNYSLHIGSDCKASGIDSAKLTLYANGKYSQEGRFKNGVQYQIFGKDWEYDNGSVFLHDLRASHTGDISPESGTENASLIVEFGKTTAIIMNPDENCFFERAE
jgi:hypothetical protein